VRPFLSWLCARLFLRLIRRFSLAVLTSQLPILPGAGFNFRNLQCRPSFCRRRWPAFFLLPTLDLPRWARPTRSVSACRSHTFCSSLGLYLVLLPFGRPSDRFSFFLFSRTPSSAAHCGVSVFPDLSQEPLLFSLSSSLFFFMYECRHSRRRGIFVLPDRMARAVLWCVQHAEEFSLLPV